MTFQKEGISFLAGAVTLASLALGAKVGKSLYLGQLMVPHVNPTVFKLVITALFILAFGLFTSRSKGLDKPWVRLIRTGITGLIVIDMITYIVVGLR
ncbi:MAG: hypothetical protein K6T76_06500 [Alicyclobacillus mali]|uniref:hypothetical protein n=1 Tax=Alicyclobacillus mali (ex Roth et al. 2021) TaxID=1123961 RepID=UPI00082C8904|nr:hypothetical protein [Alicyclobacillus mali (ex Roth et al. 2021)]MCL6488571.1 hypothetical protein [Alicyclobacillus mali (ex Roth et al. 2021)]